MSPKNSIADLEIEGFNEVALHEILYKYLYYWRWFVISLVVFFSIGYVYVKLQVPIYKIEADILIKDNKGGVNGQNDLLKELNLNTSDKIIDNEIQILKSVTLMKKVVDSLDLQTTYEASEGVRKYELYNNIPFRIIWLKPYQAKSGSVLSVQLVNGKEALVNGKRVLLNTPCETILGRILIVKQPNPASPYNGLVNVRYNNLQDVVQHYVSGIKIDAATKQSTVLVITMEDALPERGIDVLNTLIDKYNKAAIVDKNRVTANTIAFIESRLRVLATELSSVEKSVENYKSSNQITDISSQSQMFLQSVRDNDAELNKIAIQLTTLDNLKRYFQRGEQDKLPSMLGIGDPTLLALVSRLGQDQLRKETLLKTVPETNPIVSSVTDEINTLIQTISQTAENVRSGLIATRRSLELKNASYQNTIRTVPSKERGLLDVMRQQEIKNTLFTYLLQKREESNLSLASTESASRIIDAAKSTQEPVRPVKKVIYSIFIFIGILVPIVVLYFKEVLNFKVTKRADIDRLTDIPILGEISFNDSTNVLPVVEKQRSIVAEQIRSLRTNLTFINPNDEEKVLLFTSSISGEGKSFVSLNLGASIALSGKKVVILELDLRKPKLHAGLNIDGSIGLSNFLVGKVDYKSIIKEIPQQANYYIIPSGPIPPNPAELLTNGKIDILVKKLKEEFDFIILDAPPVGLVTDAQIVAPYADATLFIIRHNYSIKNHIRMIDSFAHDNKFKRLNIIFNSVDFNHEYGYGYGYSYGYGYGYGSGYYEETPAKRPWISRLFKKGQ